MDETPNQETKPGTGWNIRELAKSARDKKIGGVCGGFGEHTPIPAWLWRVAFLTSLFLGGVGLIAYIILRICMPPAKKTE